MTDKCKKAGSDGRQAEAAVKRARPYPRDDKAALESQRRACAYGRARGKT